MNWKIIAPQCSVGYVCVCVLVAQSCPTLCDPLDCSLPGSSVHRIFQTNILEWIAIHFSTGSFLPRDQTQVSCTAGSYYHWATREVALFSITVKVCIAWLIVLVISLVLVITVNITTTSKNRAAKNRDLCSISVRKAHKFIYSSLSNMHLFIYNYLSGIRKGHQQCQFYRSALPPFSHLPKINLSLITVLYWFF